MNYELGFAIMANVIFVMYLFWVSWQDFKERLVVRYSHGLGVLAIILLAILKKEDIADAPMEYWVGLIFVLLIQVAAYKYRLYGLADVLVFLICGLYFLVQKGPQLYLTAYILLQALAGCFLLGVQIAKRNVQGVRLYKPVAYIPYISFAFILTNVVV